MSDDYARKREEFLKMMEQMDFAKEPKKALAILQEMITYQEGVHDNEKDPFRKHALENELNFLKTLDIIADLKIDTARHLAKTLSTQNNFEDRITKLEKKIADMEKGR